MRKWGMTLALLCGLAAGANAAPVGTAEGPVEGFAKNGVTQFLGIPFAKPPVGGLRWMPPQPVTKWTNVRRGDKFGPTCAQITTLGPFAGPPNSNEDCLYLNVFTPDVKAKLPVLVWIHGGGYVDGETNDYDATKLAADGKLVVVTLNYRLNLFGFLAQPALDKEDHAGGNYGIMDMQAGLRWVQRNIAAFGGDPNNVTLGGQSAGAGAAAANVVSPGSRALFHRAIFQSGGYTPVATKAIAQERGAKFAAAAGCKGDDVTVAKCLRALPASKIIAMAGTPSANGPFISGPMVDGKVIPEQMIDAFNSGRFNKMPIMIGTTRDEANFNIGIAQYFRKDHAPTTGDHFRTAMSTIYSGNAGPGASPPAFAKGTLDAVLAHYPVKTTAQAAWTGAATDNITCRGQYVAGALSPHVPVYMYRFDDRSAPTYFPKMPGYQSLAYHTGDIPYVFLGYHGGPDGLPTPLNAAQRKLSDRLVAAWANFARDGNPNGKGDAPWPRWKKGADAPAYFLQDDAWSHVQTNAQFAATHQCGFWQSILLYK
ncbi:MAG: carboxylesterase family protein [Rhizomicrobium sp.]